MSLMPRVGHSLRLFGSVAVLTSSLACSARLGDFTMVSTKNIDLSQGAGFTRTSQRVKGRDTVRIILFIPTGFVPNIKDATDRALQQAPGAVALVDVVWRHEFFLIPLIYGEDSYVVEGTPVVDPALAAAAR